MMKTILAAAVLAVTAATFVGCASKHKDGVTSSYRSQWTDVAADTVKTTEAAKAVLESEGLKNVTGTSTNVDGTASGKKADGTAVNVSVQKKETGGSQVSVTVGTLGDPTLGADLVTKIKARAEVP